MTKPVDLCVNCHAAPIRARRRCSTCLTYLRKNGADRPFNIMIRHWRRQDERRHNQAS